VHLHAAVRNGSRCTVELRDARDAYSFQPGDSVHVWWHTADEIRLPEDAAA
jgi:hypothetical protein